jgi:Vault protein inter-alpha-trypsin domain
MLRAHLILLVLTIAAPAHATVTSSRDDVAVPEATIAMGAPDSSQVSIARVVTDAREVGETAVITLSVELACPRSCVETGRMMLTLPRDAAVVGLTFQRNGESLTAVSRDAIDAQQTFEQVRVIKRDPALLEWTDDSAMQLSVYPVMAGEHPTATVTVTMPRFRRLLVDVAGAHRELLAGTFAPPSEADIAAARRVPGVTSGVSLLAMPPPSLDDIDVHVVNNPAEIQACSRLVDADGPRDLTLVLVIDAVGHVATASAGDSSAAGCIARLASTWRFGAGERPIAMHYRLHLGAT